MKVYLSGRFQGTCRVSAYSQWVISKGYIFASNFQKREWSPPGVKENSRKISDKTIADIVESLIGLCYLDGGFEKSLQMCSWFGLNFKVTDEVHKLSLQKISSSFFKKLQEFLKTYENLENVYVTQNLQLLENTLRYTFTRKSLLVEALTWVFNEIS